MCIGNTKTKRKKRTTSTYPKEERIESQSNDRTQTLTRKHAYRTKTDNNTIPTHAGVCLTVYLSLLACLRERFTSYVCVCAYLFVTLFNAIFTSHCVYDIVKADIRRPLKCSMICFNSNKWRERARERKLRIHSKSLGNWFINFMPSILRRNDIEMWNKMYKRRAVLHDERL